MKNKEKLLPPATPGLIHHRWLQNAPYISDGELMKSKNDPITYKWALEEIKRREKLNRYKVEIEYEIRNSKGDIINKEQLFLNKIFCAENPENAEKIAKEYLKLLKNTHYGENTKGYIISVNIEPKKLKDPNQTDIFKK